MGKQKKTLDAKAGRVAFNPYRSPDNVCEECQGWFQQALIFLARETAFWVVMFSGLSFLLGLIVGVVSVLRN